jgi:hypothetical protein
MKKKAAIICPIKNEETYIKKFFEYYQKHIDVSDIYILDFGSSEEYIKNVIGKNATVIKTDANILDAIELFEAMRSAQKDLYKEYTYVLPLDVDEILYYHAEGGLKKYLQETEVELISSRGHEVIHLPFLQEPIDPSKKWMDQIKYWYTNHFHYGKTLISKKELDWEPGFHIYTGETVSIREQHLDPKLFLIHLHRHDFNTTMSRHIKWSGMEWSEYTLENKLNYHYTEKSEEKLLEWYYRPVFEKIHTIPEEIKKNIDI